MDLEEAIESFEVVLQYTAEREREREERQKEKTEKLS